MRLRRGEVESARVRLTEIATWARAMADKLDPKRTFSVPMAARFDSLARQAEQLENYLRFASEARK